MMRGLCFAEDAASLQAPALCMSEHLALGAFSPASGRLMLEPLASDSILHAAPIYRRGDSLSAPGGVGYTAHLSLLVHHTVLGCSADLAHVIIKGWSRLIAWSPEEACHWLCRCSLLTASESGTLRLLHLGQGSPVQAETAVLPPGCELIALSEHSNRLGVVQSGCGATLYCLDMGAVTGARPDAPAGASAPDP